MQDFVKQSFDRFGHLWERSDILLKIAEETGELLRAYRKLDSEQQQHEFGDTLFSLYALAVREEIDANRELERAVLRFEQYVNHLTATETISPSDLRDYARFCSAGCGTRIHKSNTAGLCPDCFMARKSLCGHKV
jgi:NTP pyrophosphatase (non-canonical NTP hydrolase)